MSARLNSSGCEALTPCGPPSTTTSRAPGTDAAVRWPLAWNGTIASLSQWTTSVGTSTAVRSWRKSV